MAVLVTCKIDKDPIKRKVAIVRTIFSPLYVHGKIFPRSRASNSKATSLIWPKIELKRDFMTVLTTCKFEDHQMKNKAAIDRSRSTMGFFGSQGQVTPK